MRLGFMYFESSNSGFKRDLVRYNTLLRNYFDNDDSSVVKKLNETFNSLLKNSSQYEIMTEKESKVYNVIIDFLANEVSENDVVSLNNNNYDHGIRERILNKMSKDLPSIDSKTLESVMQKSSKMMNNSNPQNIELVFIPSVVGEPKR